MISPATRRPTQFFFLRASRAAHVDDFADEFVAGRSAKIVVAAKDFDVGVADAGEADADESPAGAEARQWLADGGEGVVFCDEGEHVGLLLTKKFQIGNFRFQMEETATANAADDDGGSATCARLLANPGRPGEPGLMKAVASHRTPKIHWHAATIAAARVGSSSGKTVRRSRIT